MDEILFELLFKLAENSDIEVLIGTALDSDSDFAAKASDAFGDAENMRESLRTLLYRLYEEHFDA